MFKYKEKPIPPRLTEEQPVQTKVLSGQKPFTSVPNRIHESFPDIQPDLLVSLDDTELDKWLERHNPFMTENNTFICKESTLNFKRTFISRYRQGMFCYCSLLTLSSCLVLIYSGNFNSLTCNIDIALFIVVSNFSKCKHPVKLAFKFSAMKRKCSKIARLSICSSAQN